MRIEQLFDGGDIDFGVFRPRMIPVHQQRAYRDKDEEKKILDLQSKPPS
jgi:hypothetical protein